MTKLNDEQLSRILTAHANGGLIRYGHTSGKGYPGCVAQIAFGMNNVFFGDYVMEGIEDYLDFKLVDGLACWFDSCYDFRWTVEEFMDIMLEKGFI